MCVSERAKVRLEDDRKLAVLTLTLPLSGLAALTRRID